MMGIINLWQERNETTLQDEIRFLRDQVCSLAKERKTTSVTRNIDLDAEILQNLTEAVASGKWLVTIHAMHNGKIRHFFKATNSFPPAAFCQCAEKLRADGFNRMQTAKKQTKRERKTKS